MASLSVWWNVQSPATILMCSLWRSPGISSMPRDQLFLVSLITRTVVCSRSPFLSPCNYRYYYRKYTIKDASKNNIDKKRKKPGFLFVTCMSLLFTRRNWQVTLLTNIINGKNLTLFGLKISGHLVQCGQFIV